MTERLFLEYSLNANLNKRRIESGYWTYEVNLINMTQTNVTHSSHTSRRIRRVLANTPQAQTPVVHQSTMAAAAPVVTPPTSTPITPKKQAQKAAAIAASPTAAKKKGSHPVDVDVTEKGRRANDFTVVQNGEGVWYDVVLNQCNITGSNNNNKYYRIQMLQEVGGGSYYVWLKWGKCRGVSHHILLLFK